MDLSKREVQLSKRSEIKFIKPCIHQGESHAPLTAAYMRSVANRGRIVQINLDNCSIQRMEELSSSSTREDAEAVGLLPLIELLESAPVSLTAIGVDEMPDWRVQRAMDAYQNFCQKFWPNHRDDFEATMRAFDPDSENKKVVFSQLSDSARCTYGLSYVAMLQIQNIQLNFGDRPPTEKFEIYMHSMSRMLDLLTAYDMEIAKYAFWDLTSNEINQLPENVRLRRKNIKQNFYKLSSNLDKCRWFAFDAAMDIYWLSGANLAENLGVTLKADGHELTIENWVGTNDHKLFSICQDIHSVYMGGATMKALESTRENCLSETPYWQYVDRFAQAVMDYRKRSGYRDIGDLLRRVDSAIEHIEGELVLGFTHRESSEKKEAV
ncbi:hypothetical protein AB4098_00720 [Vibrio cyclitrophicus]